MKYQTVHLQHQYSGYEKGDTILVPASEALNLSIQGIGFVKDTLDNRVRLGKTTNIILPNKG